MLTDQENELLVRVEGDAPMGQIFRRHWVPACMSEEVPVADGAPIKIRLLGEDLVVFRDSDGKVGVLDEYCPHRRASLVFGRNEECGLRCLYHGWKFDVDGNTVDMPSEPSESGLAAKTKHKSYPVHEEAGFVWVYMGPAAEKPEFEAPVFARTPETKFAIAKIVIDCNWAQVLEGAIDSSHSSNLHQSDMVPSRVTQAKATTENWLRPSTDKAPRLFVNRTTFGFRYSAIRRPIFNADTHDYVRTTLFIAPYTVQIPRNDQYNIAILHIPMDDTHTAFHFIAWGSGADNVPDTEFWRKFLGAQVGTDVDSRFRKIRVRDNNYLQDRTIMKLGNFSGITGIPNQDIAMWETMGPIADRSRDKLGAGDLAIVEFRRVMVEAAQAYVANGTVIGRTEPHVPQGMLLSFEGVVEKGYDWRTLGATEDEIRLTGGAQAAE